MGRRRRIAVDLKLEASMSQKIYTAAMAFILAALSGAALASYADDRAEIVNISNRYMVAVDAGDIDTVMSTWAEDGVLDWVRGVENGKDAIRKAMSNFGGAARAAAIPDGVTSRPRTRHQIINHVIDVNGDTAKTIAYWFAITNNTPQKDVQLMYFGHYEDELVKRNGKWLFKHRKVYNESLQNRSLFYPGLGEKDPRKK
jgi:ketosteroid isomerase-like protein